MVGKRLKGKGRVSMVKGVERVLPISLPGVKKLLHNINTHRYCVPKTIKLFGYIITKQTIYSTNNKYRVISCFI